MLVLRSLEAIMNINKSKKVVLALVVYIALAGSLNAQTLFPNAEYWSFDAGLGLSDILVKGSSFQCIFDPKLSVTHTSMVGSKFGVNYSSDSILTFEAQAYYRYNFLRLGKPENTTNVFLQGGIGLVAAYRGEDNPFDTRTLTRGSVLLDAALGVTIPLSARWHIEPSFRGGYPHLYGVSVTAGYKFPIKKEKTQYLTEYVDRTQYVEIIKTIPTNEILKRIVINAVEYIIFAGDIYTYNAVIDRDAQALNDMVIMHVAEMLAANPDLRVRVEGHANPVTRAPREIDELLDLSTYRSYEVARVLREKGVSNEQIVIAAYGGTRTFADHDDIAHWNMNRRCELFIIEFNNK